MADKLTTKDVLHILTDVEDLLKELLPLIAWDIKGPAEKNLTFDLKVRSDTCYDQVAYAKKHSDEWVEE